MATVRKRSVPVIPILIAIFAVLVLHRIWRSSNEAPGQFSGELSRVSVEEQRILYLQPGGRYTLEDIQANGRQVPSERYRRFRAEHSVRTRPGDPLCPITKTLANPACTWMISGQKYQFCCPPCIDEFVRMAKESPELVRPANTYVHR